jgi:two-component system NarL family response regulator
MTAEPIRVLIVDDHPLFRAGVAAILDDSPDIDVVGEAGTGHEGIDAWRRLLPDVALVDLQLPDMEGTRVIGLIRAHTPAARVIVLTTYGGDGNARRALSAGANGYLLKTSLVDDLVSTLRAVHAGQQRIAPEVAQNLTEHYGDQALSERELDVLRGVALGLENKQIAVRLGLSAETVKEYLSNAMGKLRASNRAHAIAIAMERGFLR